MEIMSTANLIVRYNKTSSGRTLSVIAGRGQPYYLQSSTLMTPGKLANPSNAGLQD